MMMKKPNGIIFIVLAALGWSLCGVLLKFINASSFVINSARSWVGLVGMILLAKKKPVFYIKDEEGKISSRDTLFLWLGGASFALTAITFVIANKMTTAANAIFLQYTNPIWIILLSPIILGEKSSRTDFLCVAGVFLGMILFFADELKNGISNMNQTAMAGNIVAIISGIFMCFTTIFIRKQKSGKSIESFMLSQLIVAVIFTPMLFKEGLPDLRSCIFIILTGIFVGALPGIFYPIGLRTVPALSASLISMLEPLMSPVFVLIFYGECPTIMCVAGGILILCFIVLREVIIRRSAAVHE